MIAFIDPRESVWLHHRRLFFIIFRAFLLKFVLIAANYLARKQIQSHTFQLISSYVTIKSLKPHSTQRVMYAAGNCLRLLPLSFPIYKEKMIDIPAQRPLLNY